MEFIISTIENLSPLELSGYWGISTSEKTKVFDWIELVSEHSKKMRDTSHLDIKQMILEYISLI